MTIIDKLKSELEQQLRDPHTHCYGISAINKVKEILALIEKLEADHFANADKMDSEETELNSLAFLEELGYTCVPPSEVKDVAEAAEKYSNNLDYYHYTGDDPSIAFRAGAFWQKAQDHDACRSCEKSRDAVFQKGMKCAEKQYVDIGRATVVEGEEGNEIFFDDFKRIVGDTFQPGDILEIKAIKHIDKWTQQN